MSRSGTSDAVPAPLSDVTVGNLLELCETISQARCSALRKQHSSVRLPGTWMDAIASVTLMLDKPSSRWKRVRFHCNMVRDCPCRVTPGKTHSSLLENMSVDLRRLTALLPFELFCLDCSAVKETREVNALDWSYPGESKRMSTFATLQSLAKSDSATALSALTSGGTIEPNHIVEIEEDQVTITIKHLKSVSPDTTLHSVILGTAAVTTACGVLLSIEERDKLYTEMFKVGEGRGLRPAHADRQCMALLNQRGITTHMLKQLLHYPTIRQWTHKTIKHFLRDPKFADLPITGGDNSLFPEDGLFLPTLTPSGKIVGGQVKPFHVEPGAPRYRTLGAGVKKSLLTTSRGLEGVLIPKRCHLLPSGATPHHVWIPKAVSTTHVITSVRKSKALPENCVVGICEGGLKPMIAAICLKHAFIGAWGAEFNHDLVAEYVAEMERTHFSVPPRTAEIRLYPDAGSAVNTQIGPRLIAVGCHLFDLGYRVKVAWWGQTFKNASDFKSPEHSAWYRVEHDDLFAFPLHTRTLDVDEFFEPKFTASDAAKPFNAVHLSIAEFVGRCSPAVQSVIAKTVTCVGQPIIPVPPSINRTSSDRAVEYPRCMNASCPAELFVRLCLNKPELPSDITLALQHLCVAFRHDRDGLMAAIVAEHDKLTSLVGSQIAVLHALTGDDVSTSTQAEYTITLSDAIISLWDKAAKVLCDSGVTQSQVHEVAVPVSRPHLFHLVAPYHCEGVIVGSYDISTGDLTPEDELVIVPADELDGSGWTIVRKAHSSTAELQYLVPTEWLVECDKNVK